MLRIIDLGLNRQLGLLLHQFFFGCQFLGLQLGSVYPLVQLPADFFKDITKNIAFCRLLLCRDFFG